MIAARSLLVWAAAVGSVVVFPSSFLAAKSFGTISTIQMPLRLTLVEAVLWEVDGDGHPDLILSVRENRTGGRRLLQIHRRRDPSQAKGDVVSRSLFVNEPDATLPLTSDVVAFGVGDVHADPGNEIVLFTASAVFAWRPRAKERDRFVKLFSTDFLWQLPDPDGVFAWTTGIRRIDGDELFDVLVPEPGGYKIAFQGRGEDGASTFDRALSLRIPEDLGLDKEIGASRGGGPMRTESGGGNITLSLGFGGGSQESKEPSNLFSVSEEVPSPHLVDWNGDGLKDLVAQTRNSVHVWLQDGDGVFTDEPISLQSPVPVDRDRVLDFSYSSHVVDLDGDHRADVVFIAGDKRSDDARTQVLVFLQAGVRTSSPFGKKGIPRQLLVLDGFAGSPKFNDVNGDGRPDLTLACLRPDLIDQIRSSGDSGLAFELTVYLNHGNGFSKRPDLIHRVRLNPGTNGHVSRFVGDLSGDGSAEFLLREVTGELRLLISRGWGRNARIFERPLFEMDVSEGSRVIVARDDPSDDAKPELLILDDRQVHHVRFP